MNDRDAVLALFSLRTAALAVLARGISDDKRIDALIELARQVERTAWVDDAAQGIER